MRISFRPKLFFNDLKRHRFTQVVLSSNFTLTVIFNLSKMLTRTNVIKKRRETCI